MWNAHRYGMFWWGGGGVLAPPALFRGTGGAVRANPPPNSPVPADLFIQSVVKLDGTLGWHQLCPSLQAQMPLSELTSQVETQRIAASGHGLTLTESYIGAHPRPQGGEVRVYVVTAHRPNCWVEQRTYSVYTQASGCVEDIKNS